MVWTMAGKGEFGWPAELEAKSHVKGNAKNELTDVLADVDLAKAQHAKVLSTFPYPPSKASVSKAGEWGNGASDYFSSAPVKKLAGSLLVIVKRVEALEKTKVSTEAKKSLKAIRESCQANADGIDAKTVLPHINTTTRTLVEADKASVLKNLRPVLGTFKACAKKGHPAVAAAKDTLRAWPADTDAQTAAAQQMGNALFTDCRDMTQNLMNLDKATKYGVDLTQFGIDAKHVAAIPRVSAVLVPFANAQSGSSLTAGKDRAALIEFVKKIDTGAKIFDQIAAQLP